MQEVLFKLSLTYVAQAGCNLSMILHESPHPAMSFEKPLYILTFMNLVRLENIC